MQRIGPSTSSGLATAAGLSERWVREWLYQQAAAGFVCTDPKADIFWLSEGQADILVEAPRLEGAKESPLELMLMMPTVLSNIDKTAVSFRTGMGLTFDELGIVHKCYTHRHARGVQLEKRLRALPGLTQKLEEGIKVADIGCGSGEVLLHLASKFPHSTFVGYDISKQALEIANQRKNERSLTNVTFLNPVDGPQSRLPCSPTFHLILMQEAIHDMSNPQQMLTFIRQSLLNNSSSSSGLTTSSSSTQQADALADYNGDPLLLITDIQSTGSPASNISDMPLASMLYGMSVAVCMSSALSEPGGAGLGTVGFHEGVARQMSSAAGFSKFSKLDWEGSGFSAHYMFRP